MATINLSAEQRQALSIGRHLVVRANAGSGKTFVLTVRFAWLLLEHGVPLEHIVAITFTTKAAAEMRARLQQLLMRLLDDPEMVQSLGMTASHEVVTSRITDALCKLGKARISTFHSFASSLVRKHGFDIGVNPESRDLTERDRAKLLHSSMRGAIRSALSSNLLTVAHEHLGIEQTEKHITMLMSSGEHLDRILAWRTSVQDVTEFRLTTLPKSVVSVVLASCTDILEQLVHLGSRNNTAGTQCCDTIEAALHTIQDGGKQTAHHIRSLIQLITMLYTKSGTGKKAKAPFPQTADLKPLSKSMMIMAEWAIADPNDEVIQTQILESLLSVATNAELLYTKAKRTEQVLDFDDMMRYAVKLLGEHPSIANAVRSGIRYLMVDEFQDTNPLQYELITLLVPDLLNQGKRQTELFVVGDDKQSIYGFRNADVRLFRAADEAVTSSNRAMHIDQESSLHLENSYRMTAVLADRVNHVCKHCFTMDTEFDVAYTALISKRAIIGDQQIGSMRLHEMNSSTASDEEQSMTADPTEVEAVAHHVRDILSGADPLLIEEASGYRAPNASDIAVLVQKRDTVSAIARHLHTLGIPVQIHGGRAFFSRPEIADVRNLLTALLHNNDALALAAVLRSPFFRCTDADILELAALHEKGILAWHNIQIACEHPVSLAIRTACTTLLELAAAVHTMSTVALIQYAIERTGWHQTLTDDQRREQVLRNMAKLFDIIHEAEEADGATTYDVVASISIPDGQDNEAEASGAVHGSGVQVMTIHSAKGLEFPVVILAGISSASPASSVYFSDELGPAFSLSGTRLAKDGGSGFVPVQSGNTYQANKLVERLREQAEVRRLLYVALTRAQFHILVVLRTSTTEQRGTSCKSPIGSIILEAKHLFENFQVSPAGMQHHISNVVQQKTISLVEEIPFSDQPDVFSITDLIEAPTEVSGTSNHHARQRGIEVHEAVAQIILHSRHTEQHADPIVQQFCNSHAAWAGIPEDALVEREFVVQLDTTIIIGRPDLVFTSNSGELCIWDWKVIAPANKTEREKLLAHYKPQLAGYAWLLMKGNPSIPHVRTRLLFVPLATEVLHDWSDELVFARDDAAYVEALIRSRIAIPAA